MSIRQERCASYRVITHHEYSIVLSHTDVKHRYVIKSIIYSCFYTPSFVYLPTGFRAFTHRAFPIHFLFQALVSLFQPFNTRNNYISNTQHGPVDNFRSNKRLRFVRHN
jgi:hypothetical protein